MIYLLLLFLSAGSIQALPNSLDKRDCDVAGCFGQILKSTVSDVKTCYKATLKDGKGLISDFQCINNGAQDIIKDIKECDGCSISTPCDMKDGGVDTTLWRFCGNPNTHDVADVGPEQCAQLKGALQQNGRPTWYNYYFNCGNQAIDRINQCFLNCTSCTSQCSAPPSSAPPPSSTPPPPSSAAPPPSSSPAVPGPSGTAGAAACVDPNSLPNVPTAPDDDSGYKPVASQALIPPQYTPVGTDNDNLDIAGRSLVPRASPDSRRWARSNYADTCKNKGSYFGYDVSAQQGTAGGVRMGKGADPQNVNTVACDHILELWTIDGFFNDGLGRQYGDVLTEVNKLNDPDPDVACNGQNLVTLLNSPNNLIYLEANTNGFKFNILHGDNVDLSSKGNLLIGGCYQYLWMVNQGYEGTAKRVGGLFDRIWNHRDGSDPSGAFLTYAHRLRERGMNALNNEIWRRKGINNFPADTGFDKIEYNIKGPDNDYLQPNIPDDIAHMDIDVEVDAITDQEMKDLDAAYNPGG